jgi:hypothetical protein
VLPSEAKLDDDGGQSSPDHKTMETTNKGLQDALHKNRRN